MSQPEVRLRLYGPGRTEDYIISPESWENIQVYGTEILLTGWLSNQEFRRWAALLNAGKATFQFAHTHMKNLLLPVAGLNPLNELFDNVRLPEA